MSSPGTICFVHAHPDDEALFTAGTSRWYAEQGYRVILITCTNGRLGIDDQWLAGSDPRHHTAWVRHTRASELAAAAPLAGVHRLITLGYDDSGMAGWPQNEDPTSFMNANTEAVARTIASILDEENAVVVVTYDENGYYGHPDHVMANVVTRRACQLSQAAQRLFYPVTPARVLARFVPEATERGVHLPAWVLDAGEGWPDDRVDVAIDATATVAAKRATIAAHASQVDNAELNTMDEDLFVLLFGSEYYALGWSRHSLAVNPNDLFGGMT